MELIANDQKMKEIFKDAIIEMIRSDREGIIEIIVQAIEEVGLPNAIEEGRKNKFVDKGRIMKTL